MKIRLFAIVLFFAAVALIAGETILESFTAKSDGKVITVEWKSTVENNINRYEVERSNSDDNFIYVTSIDARGYPSNYKYIDEEAFMRGGDSDTPLFKNLYYYRIKIVKNDGTYVYSNTINVTHYISSIRRTWGMIKEMFR